MPGPPPNPNAVRRNARVGMTRLPADGRKGRPPKWPLAEDPTLKVRIELLEDDLCDLEERELDDELTRTERTKLARLRERIAVAKAKREAELAQEKDLWRQLWKTPQAVEWERQHWTHDVALYVRHVARASLGSQADSTEARLRADGLGLTPKGRRSLMWVIDSEDEVGAKRTEQAAPAASGVRARNLKAVDGGA